MSRREAGPAPAGGLVVVDKPAGWTSHDVVARTRRLAGTRRVGHAGTLDPMATGVLVLGVGRTTKLLTHLVRADKEYLATVRLGESTTTDDAEGETTTAAGAPRLDRAALEAAALPLTGSIEQVPSSVSAIKVDGRRAYALVRGGEEVALRARPVQVDVFELGEPRAATGASGVPVVDVDVRVVVSSGTYVRALARDLGAALEVGGHLVALRRTRVGPYALEGARTLEQLEEAFAVLPLADAARAAFPVRELTEAEALDLRHGRSVAPADGAAGTREAPVAAFAPDGALVALVHDERGATRPSLVLQPA
ncbi:tRNA pseudouridine(55) synthase TruB [uncultured Pseudokineococcus sp.]|uniref:tRNA pseudouridine(55) synthase TruB n=1 Tax=uncultured Pseudokineococcus sp. TaxID=1642928 RepID=UPI002621EAE0|nr:tRNA pseudouridine(55) synthase TruB [uncultured Pseudokineococcus sp.]